VAYSAGTGNSLLQHDNPGNSLTNGLEPGSIGAVTGAVIGGISGGIGSALNGRNIWTVEKAMMPIPRPIINTPRC